MIVPDPAAPAAPGGDPLSYHGGRLDQAARRFPDAPRPWLDLSTGINPHAWPIKRAAPPDLRGLPTDAALERLCAVAAQRFGVGVSAVAAVPGSEIGLRMLSRQELPRPWRIVSPGYRTHAAALPGARAIDAGMVAEEAGRGGTILLAHPNNPDGHVWRPDALLAVARRLARGGGVLVVDEAFVDAVPGASILPLLASDDRVIVFRSFGKFYGLAGLRLGFVCGAPALVARIAAGLGSWPVSSPAIAYGTAAYADDAWITAMQATLVEASAALDRILAGHGLAARGACPLFRLIETDDAATLFARLAGAGILTRPFDHSPRWLRFGLPADGEALARLDRALGDAVRAR